MSLQFTSETITGRNVVFDLVLEDIPGGCSMDTDRFVATNKWLEQGTPVYVDKSTRIAYLVKTVEIYASAAANGFLVADDHNLTVGDVLWDGTSGQTISAITASGTGYDYITLAGNFTTYVADTALVQVTASGGGGTATYTPNGFVKDTVAIGDGSALYDNIDVSVVVRGAVRESALPFPLSATFKTALTHFTFNA